MAVHLASVSGSLVGRFAFIGKSVRGRLSVSFQSDIQNELYCRVRRARENEKRARTALTHLVDASIAGFRPGGRGRPVQGGQRAVAAKSFLELLFFPFLNDDVRPQSFGPEEADCVV